MFVDSADGRRWRARARRGRQGAARAWPARARRLSASPLQFLEGDPDRPIITGRVYNGDNKPPCQLPDNRTQSGIKTRSSKDRNPERHRRQHCEAC
jgi:type VI secretion system secreted protein VgrG